MLRSVFGKSLWDQRRALLSWGLGMAALVVVTVSTHPAVRDTPGLAELEANLPEAFRAFLGEQSYSDPAGYVNSQLLFSLVPLVVLVIAIGRGADTIAGEEFRGTLGFLLSLPVSRRRVVAEKLLALTVGIALVTLLLFLSLWISGALFDLGLEAGGYVAASVSALLLGLAFGALAVALAAATGNRGLAVGIAASVAFATYLLNSLAALVEALEPVRPLSPFYWSVGNDPLVNGLRPATVAVLLGIAVAFSAIALLAFDRRDVGR
jgi:ABC-2 type transport system permease protein